MSLNTKTISNFASQLRAEGESKLRAADALDVLLNSNGHSRRGGKRVLTAAARHRISMAMKLRWANRKREQKKSPASVSRFPGRRAAA